MRPPTRDIVVTSFRPSVIFGPGDSFFNRFAALLNIAPGRCLSARLPAQPPCAGLSSTDVVGGHLPVHWMMPPAGERLQLCGPDELHAQAELRELHPQTSLQLKTAASSAWVTASHGMQATMLGLPCRANRSRMDNYHSLQHDSVCTDNALPTLGIKPTPVAAVVPG